MEIQNRKKIASHIHHIRMTELGLENATGLVLSIIDGINGKKKPPTD